MQSGSDNEFHAYPFFGTLPSADDATGTFTIAKALAGTGADPVADETTMIHH